MLKVKAKTKDCQLRVRVKLTTDNNINSVELDAFSRRLLKGFLRPKQIKSRIIEYYGPIGISLYRRLQLPITKFEFFFIVAQVIDAVQKLQKNKFSANNVIWDMNYVYINEATKEIQLMYMPFAYPHNGDLVSAFLESLSYQSKPSPETDTNYVARFLYYLRSMKGLNSIQIEKYIASEAPKVMRITKNNVKGGSSGFMTDKQKSYLEHYDDEATGLLEEDDESTGLLDEGTSLLDESEETGLLDDEGTALLNESDNPISEVSAPWVHYPTLRRLLTDEVIEINKPVFRIGKEKSFVDFFISNNSAISRSHVDIVTRGDRFFVIDRNSKNKTYLNGQLLPPHQEYEILDGNQLRLANEDFIFSI